jgi:mRNA interferase MazF
VTVELELERGAVVTVRLDAGEGSEIRRTRPAVVVSNDAACRFDAVVQIVPITRLPDRDLRPYESRVESEASGVTRPSRLVANQIRTISKLRIGRRIGRLDPLEIDALDRALEIQLGLGQRR